VDQGDPTDFDGWAQGGAPGWSYADLEPYFRRVEGYADEGAAHLGTAGPLYLENRVGHGVNPAALDFVAAAEVRGHRRLNDFSGPGGAAGAGVVTVNVRDGRRFGAREAHLEPALSRDTLELWADTRAVQVNLEKGRCVGVTVLRDGVSTVVRASREVVLCASVVETPKLLMLSGIGPEDHLRAIGIPVRHALSGVGANFHDHASVGGQFNTSREVPLTDYVFDAAVFFRSEPDWVGADLETLFYVRSFQNGQFGAGIGMRTGLLRPMSRGTIRLRSGDPTEPAVLDPRLFFVDSDVDRLAVGVRESLAIAATAPLGSWIAGLDANDLRPLASRTAASELIWTMTSCGRGCGPTCRPSPTWRVGAGWAWTRTPSSTRSWVPTGWTRCGLWTSASCRPSCRDTPRRRSWLLPNGRPISSSAGRRCTRVRAWKPSLPPKTDRRAGCATSNWVVQGWTSHPSLWAA
jgi:GMC oxidoreductase